MIDSIVLTSVAGVILFGYKLFDPNKNMERHFHQNSRFKYYALQFAIIVLTLSVVFHGRHVAGTILKKGYKLLVTR